MEQLLSDIWSSRDGVTALKKRCAALAAQHEAVGLALARFEVFIKDRNAAIVGAALRTEGGESADLVVALVLAQCHEEENTRTVRNWLANVADVVPVAASARLHALSKAVEEKAQALRAKKKTQSQGDEWEAVGISVVSCLAEIGETKHAEALLSKHPNLGPTLLHKGLGVDAAIARLETLGADEDLRGAVELMTILADGEVKRAAPAILRYVRSPIFLHAFAALAKLGDAAGAEAARVMLRESCGNAWMLDIIRLGCEHMLRAVGEEPPLDLARASVAWPIIRYSTDAPEATLLRAMAVSALARSENAEDRALARGQIRSPFRIVREAASAAFDKPPQLVSWDPGRSAFVLERDGTEPLLAALDDPHAVHAEYAVEALAKHGESTARVAEFIVGAIEARMPTYYRDSFVELDPDIDVYLRIGRDVAGDPAGKVLAESSNPWIKVRALRTDAKQIEGETRTLRPDRAPPRRKARVERFDRPAHVFPRGIERVALAEEAERLLVVGPETAVLDPQLGVRLFTLPEGAPVTACAIAADGARIALARGNKITVQDGTTGESVLHHEVADGVTALAFAPEGTRLAYGTRSTLAVVDLEGKGVFTTEAPGEVHGAGWLSPKRLVFLTSKQKGSVLVDIDVAKKKTSEVPIPFATQLATSGKLLATAGRHRAAIHDAKLKPKLELKTDTAVLDLAIESSKSLLLCLETGIHRAKLGGKAPKVERVGRVTGSALTAAGARIYVANQDAIARLHDDPKARVTEGVHSQHVCSITVLPDGRLVTNGWDGRVLLWSPEGGVAETLFDRKARVDHVAISHDNKRVYFGDGHNLRCIDLASRAVTCIVGGEDTNEDVAKGMPKIVQVAASKTRLAWAGRDGVRVLDAATASEIAYVPMAKVEALAADADGRFYVGTDAGRISCLSGDGAVVWEKNEHGTDVLGGKLYGNPHRSVAYLVTHGALLASVASDSTVRVFDGLTGTRMLRCFRRVGIFNAVAFSPSGDLLAYTVGGALEVRALDGTLVSRVDDWAGTRREAMGVAWSSDAVVHVGMGDGAMFVVTLEP